MDIHPNARSCAHSRVLVVERVRQDKWTVAEAAEAAGLSERTVYKWLGRFDSEGLGGLADRSSRPHHSPNQVTAYWQRRIVTLRKRRLTGYAIARRLGIPRSTVARVLKRCGLSRLKLLDPKEPVQRYEYDKPGELIHLDIKKLVRIERIGHRIHGNRRRQARGAGWEFVHVCVDDHSRVALAEVLEDELGTTAADFLRRSVAGLKRLNVIVTRVLTDNGACYRSKAFAQVCRDLGIRHIRTKPYRPQTNGKAERFIGTMVREWAYAKAYIHSRLRAAALPVWLLHYNHAREHGSLGGRTPISLLP